MIYELYYWAGIQGRGEFVRLALEEAGARYIDVAREKGREGEQAMLRFLSGREGSHVPFAPPFLKAGRRIIGQTANILQFLGARHALAPRDEAGRLWTHQLQLTLADLLVEAHDTHHPIASGLYYEEQRREAKRRAADFRTHRLPKYLGYFEGLLERGPRGGRHLVGARLTYVDLSMFQMIEGLRYAFPRTLAGFPKRYRRLHALAERIRERPRIAAYLASARRIPFNEQGIFRHYAALDG
jgi:glutathione S-transferase